MTEAITMPEQQPESQETNEHEQTARRWVKPRLHNFQRGRIVQNGDAPGAIEGGGDLSYEPDS